MTQLTVQVVNPEHVTRLTGADTQPGEYFMGYHVFRGGPHERSLSPELMFNFGGGIAFLERGTWVDEKASVKLVRRLEKVSITAS